MSGTLAQHEVLGGEAQRHVRPGRDDRKRSAFGLGCGSAIVGIRRSSRSAFVPQSLEERRRRPDYGGQAGTDRSLKTLTQHFVLGYFRWVPAGLIFSNSPMTCAILIATP
jgi:hypothetical protein